MICPICQSDKIKIMPSPIRGDKADYRDVYCTECNQHYTTETRITKFVVGEISIPVEKAQDYVEERRKSYYSLCESNSKQTPMF